MATWCDNYSPLHDQFWLAMTLSETVSRINRATNTDDPCSTSGDSISNCLCNFRQMTIKSRPNTHELQALQKLEWMCLQVKSTKNPL